MPRSVEAAEAGAEPPTARAKEVPEFLEVLEEGAADVAVPRARAVPDAAAAALPSPPRSA
ncbi:hypothetical protein ACWD4F_04840 [Streptomyces aureus]|uniref:hypothetical protein n=1 Tax=Streptomyces aureus TaxID=193461 RepID=UPI001FD726F1|nr:hypothetical protein [Streptomyces aureus]